MNDPSGAQPGPDSTPADRQEEFIGLLNGAHAMLLRYVRSLVVNRHDAEDVLQRASVVMWRRFHTYVPNTDFVAWATTVAFYEVRNFQRATGRSRLTFDDQLLEILAAERAIDVQRWNARSEALESCVEKLDSSGRQLVQAIYAEGLAVADVAKRQQLAVQTIYNKLNLIRRALAECVERRISEASQ